MTEYALGEAVQFVGEWSLPGLAETRQISGTLAWEANRALLRLNDSFSPVQAGAVYGDEVCQYAVVHGISTASEHLSILNATRVGSGYNLGPAGLRQTERLVSSWIVVGEHVTTDTLYREFSFRIPGLQLWNGRSGVTRSIINRTDSSPMSVAYEFEHLPEELIEVPAIEAKVCIGLRHLYSGDLLSEIRATINGHLTIRPDQPQTLEWFFDQRGKLLTLLSFIAGSPMAHDHAEGVLSEGDRKVQVLTSLREPACCAFQNPSEFFMARRMMGVDFATVCQNWFERYQAIETPSQLALSVLNTRNLWSHVEFLSLMQALEGFHRAILPGLYTTVDEYAKVHNELCKAIPASVGSDHRESLKSRIKYGNEISLRKRLDALVAKLPENVRRMVLGGNGQLPRRWVVTRNYYTHWDDASKNDILDGVELHRASVRMRLLLRVLYLDFLGVQEDAMLAALTDASSEAQYLIQLNSAEMRAKNPGAQIGAIMHITMGESDPQSSTSLPT
ncbi:HEPN domain-containing protein [Pseudoduganella sp. R-31]|uniref:HEPN domain-containing protein n=1 Tax=Pseudoduganella sp. R-31 TaxID=3404060 RepID=UPI003CFA49BD